MNKAIRCRSASGRPIAVFLLLLLTHWEVPAKRQTDRLTGHAAFFPVTTNRPLPLPSLPDLENRVRTFLENRRTGETAFRHSPGMPPPGESDLLLLARAWDRVSPEFKALYEAATIIPDSFAVFVSPGGHFELYYTVGDPAIGVDGADTMGYGRRRHDWRIRSHAPNGIPDYVDETAWAFDSAWSMLVDRFAFVPPIPYRDARHATDRYRVVITGLGSGEYGCTFPKGKAEGTAKGFSSHIEIRNAWRGEEWRKSGYDVHPEDGIRVTGAHELFHAVQYAMTWNAPYGDDLDDFPLAWLEGTAVLMEELAFDSVNDYLQYADYFFDNPSMSFFDGSGGTAAYANSLLVKYLFEKATGAPCIDFIRHVFFATYEKAIPFHANLRSTSPALGIPWVVALNRFFSASYFSGSRADTSRFLGDAPLFGEWRYSGDTILPLSGRAKTAAPYATQLFEIKHDGRPGDSLIVGVACRDHDPGDTLPRPSWAASCILINRDRPDSVFVLPLDNAGRALCRINDWKSRRKLLLFVTNGHPYEKRTATVYDPTPARMTIVPNPARLGSKQSMRFTGNDIREIRMYAADGTLVCCSAGRLAGAIRPCGGGFEWRLTNARGAPVAPGFYTAIIIRKETPGDVKKAEQHKVLVYP